MRKYHFFICFISICLFVCCCKQNNKITAKLDNYCIDSDSIDIPLLHLSNLDRSCFVKYSDIFDSVKMVKLETTEQSLIGRISSISMLPNENLLVYDRENKKILLFDKNGKFLNGIGEYGKGNNEYISPLAPVYDKYHNEIIIWDHSKKTFLFYDIKGTYLRDVKFPYWFGTFTILDENHFAIYMNYDVLGEEQNEYGYNVLIVSKNGEIIKRGLKYSLQAVPLKHVCENIFSNGEKVFCNPVLSSIVFEVLKDTICPHCILDFGEAAIPYDWYGKYDVVEIHDKLMSRNNSCYCRFFAETKNAYVMNIIRNGYLNICIVPKENENEIIFSSVLCNDMFGETSTVEVNSVFENKLLSVLYAEEFLSVKKQLSIYSDPKERRKALLEAIEGSDKSKVDQETVSFFKQLLASVSLEKTEEEIEFINSFDGSENPVIQIATLKEY